MNWEYPLIMSAAITTGVVLSRRSQRPLALGTREKLGILVGAFCGSMLAAKLPFVLADWPGMISGAAWLSDGKTMMFGLVGGYFGVELAKWALDIRLKTGDSFAVPVAASIAVGRLACFSAGCCYGSPTLLPWGVNFGDGVPRHPTQLYETGFHTACACLLAVLQSRGMFRGQLIKLYFITYFAYRFATEFIRPEPRLWLGLTGYQWAAAALIPLFTAIWWQDVRQGVRTATEGAAAQPLQA